MKAMLLYKPAPIETRPLHYKEVPTPTISEGEILIKVKACGVCRSNLHMIEGDWIDMGVPSKLPIIPGHEVVGTIEEIGKNVKNLQIGERVGVQPLYNTCGECEYCLTGRENLCVNAKITGETVDGGYAEYMKAVAHHVYKIPDNLRDAEAAPLFCPGITAFRAVKLSEASPGKIIGVFGVGGVGHMAIQFAKLSGAKVIAVSRNKDHLKIAEEVGAFQVISPLEEDVISAFKGFGFADASIVFAPSDEVIEQAIKVTKKGGVVVIGVRGNIRNFKFYTEHVIKGSVIGSRAEMQNVLKIASHGDLVVKVELHNLQEANEVLHKLKINEVKGRAVLIP
jgi:propanol-preferring alcohol dehydrogenase